MVGWEFPPYITGGVGIHCKHLTKELTGKGIKITYVVPKRDSEIKVDYMNVINIPCEGLYIYNTLQNNEQLRNNAANFTYNVVKAVGDFNFDVIHCHEWVTFDAGIKLKELTGKPLILSCHATEFDRTPHNPWSVIIDKEQRGLKAADLVITVSNMMKKTLIDKYDLKESKIRVVYNAINSDEFKKEFNLKKENKLVLFLGRLFVQKGVDYLLDAAKKVLEKREDVDFFIVGTGDFMPELIKKSIELGIQDNVYFTGFVSEEDKKKYYQTSDVFLMPSISEPFGITALEAVASKTPVILSKNSGCSEVISNCLRVDFWDSEKMADYILGILEYPGLKKELIKNSYKECSNLTWDKIAEDTKKVYSELL